MTSASGASQNFQVRRSVAATGGNRQGGQTVRGSWPCLLTSTKEKALDREHPTETDEPDSTPNPTGELFGGKGEQGDAKEDSSAQLRSTVFQYIGLGMELASFTLVFTAIGYGVDSYGGFEKPFGTALGTLIGFTLGMIRFIRQVSQ